MHPPRIYWVAVLVGILAVWYFTTAGAAARRLESFTSPASASTSPASASTSAPATAQLANLTYIEDLVGSTKFPMAGRVQFYLTCFSDKIADGTLDTYSATDGKWVNFVNKDQKFAIVNPSATPQSIKTVDGTSGGVATLNTVISGPRSATYAQANTANEVPDFTIVLYGKRLEIDTAVGGPTSIDLFELYCQAPNYVRVFFETIPGSTNVNIKANIGSASEVYTLNQITAAGTTSVVPISAASLQGTGGPTIYALTYRKCTDGGCTNGELNFYLGTTQYTIPMVPPPTTRPLKLANDPVKINSTGRLNMTLYAACFWNAALNASQITDSLGPYLTDQATGTAALQVAIAQAQRQRELAAAAAARAAADEQARLAREQANLEAQLDKCRRENAAWAASGARNPTNPWRLSVEGATPVADPSKPGQCAAFSLKGFGAASASAASAASTSTTAAPAAPASLPWWYIPYLKSMNEITAAAPEIDVIGASSSNLPTTTSDTLVRGIYREILNQQDLNAISGERYAADLDAANRRSGTVVAQDTKATPSEENAFVRFWKDIFSI